MSLFLNHITNHELEVTFELGKPFYDSHYKRRKALLFLDPLFEPTDMGFEVPPYSIKGENPIADAQWRKFNAAELEIRREVLEMALQRNPEAFQEIGYPLDPKCYEFSRKAGCSCGCSPGYRVSKARNGSTNVWLRVREPQREAELEAKKKARQAEAAISQERLAPSYSI